MKLNNVSQGLSLLLIPHEQQIPRPVDKQRRDDAYYLGKKKRHTIKTQLMVNNHGIIIHKLGYKKGRRRDMTMTFIKRIIPLRPNKLLMCLTLDI